MTSEMVASGATAEELSGTDAGAESCGAEFSPLLRAKKQAMFGWTSFFLVALIPNEMAGRAT